MLCYFGSNILANGIFHVKNKISDAFINRLASDSWNAKVELRELFRKSPKWNEELQALVINATRIHKPNYTLIDEWIDEIILPLGETVSWEKWFDISNAARVFVNTPESDSDFGYYLDSLNKIAPKAYREGKKITRILKDFFKAIGVVDETKGSNFQKLFAKISDEFSSKRIDFKLYVSINPAHFLTMSNPKNDTRGATMVSCHSFNSTEYSYNCGCSGYARDPYTFIVFTASDDKNPETLNNRKTSRQIFAYMPNNGVLLQSRMYTTNSGSSYGGVDGDTPEGKVYRQLIQQEISEIENARNAWETTTYCKNIRHITIAVGKGFGGYHDWTYSDMGAIISLRFDHKENFKNFEVGTYGLCIKCGKEINHGLYCDECAQRCPCCHAHCESESMREVIGRDGNPASVCVNCFTEYYRLCAHCGEYHYYGNVTQVAYGAYVCNRCLEERYTQCECCREYHLDANIQEATNNYGETLYACEGCRTSGHCERHQECDHCGSLIPERKLTRVADGDLVCNDCLEGRYGYCEECGGYFLWREMNEAIDHNGNRIYFCDHCAENYVACDECGRSFHRDNIEHLDNDVYVCQSCLEDRYETCEECGDTRRYDEMNTLITADNESIRICDCCAEEGYSRENYVTCAKCGVLVSVEVATKNKNGCGYICPRCNHNEEGDD